MINMEVLNGIGLSRPLSASVLAAVGAGVMLCKIFQSRKQGRKECLELWDPEKTRDAFWLESFFQHRFGQRPAPAGLLREALALPSPLSPLSDLAMNWRYFSGETLSALSWKIPHRNKPSLRGIELALWLLAYPALLTLGVVLLYSPDSATKIGAVAPIILGCFSFWTFLEIAGANSVLKRLSAGAGNLLAGRATRSGIGAEAN